MAYYNIYHPTPCPTCGSINCTVNHFNSNFTVHNMCNFLICPFCKALYGIGVKHTCKTKVPMNNTTKPTVNTIEPTYYKRTIKGVEIQAIDIIKAWNLSYSEGEALTHLLRAKFKGCQEEDYRKAISHLNHCLDA